jgi:hypothetical protein
MSVVGTFVTEFDRSSFTAAGYLRHIGSSATSRFVVDRDPPDKLYTISSINYVSGQVEWAKQLVVPTSCYRMMVVPGTGAATETPNMSATEIPSGDLEEYQRSTIYWSHTPIGLVVVMCDEPVIDSPEWDANGADDLLVFETYAAITCLLAVTHGTFIALSADEIHGSGVHCWSMGAGRAPRRLGSIELELLDEVYFTQTHLVLIAVSRGTGEVHRSNYAFLDGMERSESNMCTEITGSVASANGNPARGLHCNWRETTVAVGFTILFLHNCASKQHLVRVYPSDGDLLCGEFQPPMSIRMRPHYRKPVISFHRVVMHTTSTAMSAWKDQNNNQLTLVIVDIASGRVLQQSWYTPLALECFMCKMLDERRVRVHARPTTLTLAPYYPIAVVSKAVRTGLSMLLPEARACAIATLRCGVAGRWRRQLPLPALPDELWLLILGWVNAVDTIPARAV